MAKQRKSESLFGDSEQIGKQPKQSVRRPPPAMTPEQLKRWKENAKEDYIFKHELKERFDERVQQSMQNMSRAEEEENKGVLRQLNQMREVVSRDENIIMRRSNERRKRHYTLDGHVRVYCYVKNEWPKMVIRSLTIDTDENIPIPPLGPFTGQNEFLVEVIFDPITFGIKRKIEPYIYEPTSDYSAKLVINSEEYRKLAFSFCFKRWNIPVQLNRKNGVLDEESRNILTKHLHPVLFDTIAREFVDLNEVSNDEISVLDKQCDRLFAKNSAGVSNPQEGIRLYCEASVFAKEFSMSGKSLEDLPIRVGTLIRHVHQKGSEIHARELDSSRNKQKKAKVIGTRGRR